MPIMRSYMCPECAFQMTVTLDAEQWDAPPPACPECERREMAQEFRPVAIGGSLRARAEKLAEDILENDYHVGDIQHERRPEGTPKVRYADAGRPANPSTWGIAREALEGAVQAGRQTRLQHGGGLDILQKSLKDGTQPDLIEVSKRRAIKVW